MTKVLRITAGQFSGASKMFDGTLAAALRQILQRDAAAAVASIDPLTDNSGGTKGTKIVDPGFPAAFTAGTTDAVAKAEFETALGAVRDALKELIAKTNAIRAVLPAGDALVDNLGGTAADGTIAAIDVSMTGTSSGGALVSQARANALLKAYYSRIEQLTYHVNKYAVATGREPLVCDTWKRRDNQRAFGATFAALSTDTGAAVSAAATLSKAAADALLVKLAANVATLADKLAEVVNGQAPVTVVAG